jgi:hypothetical protein
MFNLKTEIELLERCAAECALISGLATDGRARTENGALASEYAKLAQDLKSRVGDWAAGSGH